MTFFLRSLNFWQDSVTSVRIFDNDNLPTNQSCFCMLSLFKEKGFVQSIVLTLLNMTSSKKCILFGTQISAQLPYTAHPHCQNCPSLIPMQAQEAPTIMNQLQNNAS